MAGTARDEAERLVAAVLAMAGSAGARDKVTAGLGALGETVAGFLGGGQPDGDGSNPGQVGSGQPHGGQAGGGQAGGGQGGGRPSLHSGWATGSAECCVCPVCRVIAGMRDPSPETAVRLAVGAGDLATGVAGVMRAFSAMTGERPRPARPTRPRTDNPDQAWSAATRTANRPDEAWSAATNARTTESSSDTTTTGTVATTGSVATTGAADPWSAATSVSAAQAAAVHAVAAEAKAARRAAEQAAQREAARAAARRAKEAAERVAEAVRLADAGRVPGSAPGSRTPRKLDVWAAATADAGVAAVTGSETLDHDGQTDDGSNGDGRSGDVLGASAPEDRGGGVAGDGARDGDAV